MEISRYTIQKTSDGVNLLINQLFFLTWTNIPNKPHSSNIIQRSAFLSMQRGQILYLIFDLRLRSRQLWNLVIKFLDCLEFKVLQRLGFWLYYMNSLILFVALDIYTLCKCNTLVSSLSLKAVIGKKCVSVQWTRFFF